MPRTLMFFASLLIASGSAAAGEPVAHEATPQPASASEQQPSAKPAPKAEASKADAQSASAQPGPPGDVKMSGMSILGNEDAPKSLVIVPWKSSQLGAMPGLSMLLDDSARPVDKDVFMRELAYYRIKSGAK